MSEEWGPWIEHDGKGCPCVGQFVHVRLDREPDMFLYAEPDTDGRGWFGIAANTPCWDRSGVVQVIRYRIRKPRGLTILEELLENLPAPTSPKVDA